MNIPNTIRGKWPTGLLAATACVLLCLCALTSTVAQAAEFPKVTAGDFGDTNILAADASIVGMDPQNTLGKGKLGSVRVYDIDTGQDIACPSTVLPTYCDEVGAGPSKDYAFDADLLKGKKACIEAHYDLIGYTGEENPRPIAATLKMTDFVYSDMAWESMRKFRSTFNITNDKETWLDYPNVRISSNFANGYWFIGLEGARINLTYTDAETGAPIDISGTNAWTTVSSLDTDYTFGVMGVEGMAVDSADDFRAYARTPDTTVAGPENFTSSWHSITNPALGPATGTSGTAYPQAFYAQSTHGVSGDAACAVSLIGSLKDGAQGKLTYAAFDSGCYVHNTFGFEYLGVATPQNPTKQIASSGQGTVVVDEGGTAEEQMGTIGSTFTYTVKQAIPKANTMLGSYRSVTLRDTLPGQVSFRGARLTDTDDSGWSGATDTSNIPGFTWNITRNQSGTTTVQVDIDGAHIAYGHTYVLAIDVTVEATAPENRFDNTATSTFVSDDASMELSTGKVTVPQPLFGIDLLKVDKSGSTIPLGKASFEGIEAQIVSDNDGDVIVDGTTYEKGAVIATLTTDAEGKAATADKLLPQGSYLVRESGTNPTLLNDSQPLRITYPTEGALNNRVTATLEDSVVRGDVRFVKVAEGTEQRLAGVPFRIESLTTGESHVVSTDSNGYVNTAANVTKHSTNTNMNDKAAEGAYRADCGTWFSGATEGAGTPDDAAGALPYDDYRLTELRCAANDGMQLLDIRFSVQRNDTCVDLGTLTDKPQHAVAVLKTDETGKPLPGAHLTLSDTQGNTIGQWTSAADAKRFDNLAVGGYVLKEDIAPKGYELSKPIEFAVYDNAPLTQVTMVDKKTEPPTREDYKVEVVKSSDPETGSMVLPEDTITYTLQATNNDTETVPFFVIRDYIPQQTAYVARSVSDDGVYNEKGNYVEWVLRNVEPGQTADRTFKVTVDEDALGAIENHALFQTFGTDPGKPGTIEADPEETTNETMHQLPEEEVVEAPPVQDDATPANQPTVQTGSVTPGRASLGAKTLDLLQAYGWVMLLMLSGATLALVKGRNSRLVNRLAARRYMKKHL